MADHSLVVAKHLATPASSYSSINIFSRGLQSSQCSEDQELRLRPTNKWNRMESTIRPSKVEWIIDRTVMENSEIKGEPWRYAWELNNKVQAAGKPCVILSNYAGSALSAGRNKRSWTTCTLRGRAERQKEKLPDIGKNCGVNGQLTVHEHNLFW